MEIDIRESDVFGKLSPSSNTGASSVSSRVSGPFFLGLSVASAEARYTRVSDASNGAQQTSAASNRQSPYRTIRRIRVGGEQSRRLQIPSTIAPTYSKHDRDADEDGVFDEPDATDAQGQRFADGTDIGVDCHTPKIAGDGADVTRRRRPQPIRGINDVMRGTVSPATHRRGCHAERPAVLRTGPAVRP